MRNKKTLNLTIIAVFTAIIILQSFIPNIGYIRILPALPAVATIVITVSIGGALLGPKSGAILGLIWGVISLFMAYTQPGDIVSLMLFQNPVIAVVPRILVGFFSGLFAEKTKEHLNEPVRFAISGFIGSFTNTALVILFTSLFFMGDPSKLLQGLGQTQANSPLIMILIAALGFNGLIEAITSAVITPLIVIPLKKVLAHFN